MSRRTRTAREVVELYNLVVWNERDFDLAEELVHRQGQAAFCLRLGDR